MLVCLSLYKKWVKVYVSFSGFMPEVLASKIGSGFVGTSTNSLPIANSENLGYLHQAAAVEDTRLKVFGEGFDK